MRDSEAIDRRVVDLQAFAPLVVSVHRIEVKVRKSKGVRCDISGQPERVVIVIEQSEEEGHFVDATDAFILVDRHVVGTAAT